MPSRAQIILHPVSTDGHAWAQYVLSTSTCLCLCLTVTGHNQLNVLYVCKVLSLRLIKKPVCNKQIIFTCVPQPSIFLTLFMFPVKNMSCCKSSWWFWQTNQVFCISSFKRASLLIMKHTSLTSQSVSGSSSWILNITVRTVSPTSEGWCFLLLLV